MYPVASYVLPVILVFALLRKYREYTWGKCKNKVDLHGKVALVTGANSGIGYEVAKELAVRGAKVIVACRNMQKATIAIWRMKQTLSVPVDLIPLGLDLGSIESIHESVRQFNSLKTDLHILINNAGVSYPSYTSAHTQDGFEAQFGINHIGHFLLTNLLLDTLKKSAPSRVIVVSSTHHQQGTIHLDDLNCLGRLDRSGLYANSKLANAYFARELAARTKDDGVNIYTVCPGWAGTALFKHFSLRWYHYALISPAMFWYLRSPRMGAQTVVYCATEPSVKDETGLFYRDCEHFESTVQFDDEISKGLWTRSEELIKYFELKVL